MSGKQEKWKRRESGISIEARRAEAEFARGAVVQMTDRLERRAELSRNTSNRRKRIGAVIALAIAGAAIVAAVVG